MTNHLRFAMLNSAHIPAFAAIAQNAPDPWRAADLETALSGAAWHCFTAFYKEEPAAFACFNASEDSCDLQMLVTHPSFRGMGIGKALLQHSLQQMQTLGKTRCLLEVRVSNTTAISLYQSLGFRQLALRPAMYAGPREDGLLLAKELK